MSDPVLTQISGALYDPFGNQLTDGNLIISLSSSFISIDGNRVSPFVKTVAVEGDFSFSLFATENSVVGGAYSNPDPLGVRYTIEYDPEPSNQSVALVRKNGYFKVEVSIPHISDTQNLNVYELFSSTPNPITTGIIGSLYDVSGNAVVSGNLIVTVSQSFSSVEGVRVAPIAGVFPVSDISSIRLFATENFLVNSNHTSLYPLDVVYSIEYDPEPSNQSIALTRKNGYFKLEVSIPHISDTQNLNTYTLFPTVPNPITTEVAGSLYDLNGNTVTSGNLILYPNQSFESIEGIRVVPEVTIVAVTSSFSFRLLATENLVVDGLYSDPNPLGAKYTIEYDPEPSNQSIALTRKNGYFKLEVSIPHISDTQNLNTYTLFPTVPNPITTEISCSLYDDSGNALTTGKLVVTAIQSFTSIEGARVVPVVYEVSISGTFSIRLFATVNSVLNSAYATPYPINTMYIFEYDPEPSNQSIALVRKNGYFRNTLSVPHISDTLVSNVTSWSSITPAEYRYLAKLYGNINLLDNDPRLLTLAQKAALTEGGSANAYHTHADSGSSFVTLEPSNPMIIPVTDKIAIQYSETILGGRNSVNLLFENSEVVTLFYA